MMKIRSNKDIVTVFKFFNAVQTQRETGTAVEVCRDGYRVITRAMVIGVILLWWAMFVMAGHYSHLFYRFWGAQSKAAETALQAPYALSHQRYFYKKRPLPPIGESAATIDNLDDVHETDDSAADGLAEGERSEHLRERVERALQELTP